MSKLSESAAVIVYSISALAPSSASTVRTDITTVFGGWFSATKAVGGDVNTGGESLMSTRSRRTVAVAELRPADPPVPPLLAAPSTA